MNGPAPEQALQPTRLIDSDHPAIAAAVDQAGARGAEPVDAAVKLFTFVRDTIRYNPFAPMLREEDYVASTILARGYGYCVQKAALLAALSRNAGVPCKLCFADIRSHRVPGDLLSLMKTDLFTYHGYNAFYLNGRWVKATASFDRATCEKNGFRLVEFDGKKDSVLPATTPGGEPHIEYVRDIGESADVPFTDIVTAFKEVYGKANPDLLRLFADES